jgi:hypothetical protein
VHYSQLQGLPVCAGQEELDLFFDDIGGSANEVDGLPQGDASRKRPGGGVED